MQCNSILAQCLFYTCRESNFNESDIHRHVHIKFCRSGFFSSIGLAYKFNGSSLCMCLLLFQEQNMQLLLMSLEINIKITLLLYMKMYHQKE